MNPDEAKQILMLYRPDTRDAEDPQIAEALALALAKSNADLSRWLTAHFANQKELRKQFRQIAPPRVCYNKSCQRMRRIGGCHRTGENRAESFSPARFAF